MGIATITKDELSELRLKQNAVMISKAQYILCQRGFSASVGEILRRYRRNPEERLRIDLETGEIEIVSPSTVGAIDRVNDVVKDALNGPLPKVED